jgi:hypothetical protein
MRHITGPAPGSGRRFLLVWAPLLVVLALVLVACSGGGADPGGVASLVDPSAAPTAAAPEESLDPEAAMLAFAQCMRDNGIDMPDPEVSGDGGMTFGFQARPGTGTDDMDKLEAAQAACEKFLPKGGPDGRPMEIDPEMEQAMLDFARCMRENGIDFPDPQFGNGIVKIGPGEDGPNFDPSSDEFQAAQEACEDLMPGDGKFGFNVGGTDGTESGPSTNEDTETR